MNHEPIAHNQKGIAQILALVLLLVGIGTGTVLVQKGTNFLQFAKETPSSFCKTGLKSFDLLDECKAKNQDRNKKYKAAFFTCLDGTSGKVEAEKKECRSAGHLKAKAREICKKHQLCESTATSSAEPNPSCVPVPGCVRDSTCEFLLDPSTDWCDDGIINPPPSACPQVITRGCSKGWFNGWFDDFGKVCQEFPTPCDVPGDWVIDDQELPKDSEDADSKDEDSAPGGGQTGACTLEARQCRDGSWVGREGPKCEFAECPESSGDR